MIRAWTIPGPFRYEGKHFHYRYVNPWVLPLQKPHPSVWIPGGASAESVVFCSKHRYPYVALSTFLEPTIEMLNLYADVAAEQGYQSGPENFGYLQRVVVADTEETAQELGKGFMYGGGFSNFACPEWMYPPGYNSKATVQRLARVFTDPETGERTRVFTSYDSAKKI